MLHVDVRKQFPSILIQARFSTQERGITTLFGPSGAGKTSLLHMIAGLLKPDQGLIQLNGATLFDSTCNQHTPPQKRRMGVVFQDGRLFKHLSVRSNLLYGHQLLKPAERRFQPQQVIELLRLQSLLQRRPATLSGGEQQRVAIGRALLSSPHMLLMDEPLSSLDREHKQELIPFIEQLPERLGIPILYISHDVGEIIQLGDQLVMLKAGQVEHSGAVELLLSQFSPESGDHANYSVFATKVLRHEQDGITLLEFEGGTLNVPRFEAPLGAQVRVQLFAENVALGLLKPEQTSFQNILSGTVTGFAELPSHYRVEVDIGVPMMANITRRSFQELRISQGRKVFVILKAVSILKGHVQFSS